jgi:hypothetical protein
MPDIKLTTDVAKDSIWSWILNALNCELFPREGDSISNAELPAVIKILGSSTSRSYSDENHVIALQLADGNVISVLVKNGDYRMMRKGGGQFND